MFIAPTIILLLHFAVWEKYGFFLDEKLIENTCYSVVFKVTSQTFDS